MGKAMFFLKGNGGAELLSSFFATDMIVVMIFAMVLSFGLYFFLRKWLSDLNRGYTTLRMSSEMVTVVAFLAVLFLCGIYLVPAS